MCVCVCVLRAYRYLCVCKELPDDCIEQETPSCDKSVNPRCAFRVSVCVSVCVYIMCIYVSVCVWYVYV